MKRYYLIVLLILLPIVGYGYGNNIALEIISPKEATTGTPAIPATAPTLTAGEKQLAIWLEFP